MMPVYRRSKLDAYHIIIVRKIKHFSAPGEEMPYFFLDKLTVTH